MALAPGTRLGVHEIVGALGAGGMGEVYRARDSKLGRVVAIKVLPEAFAFDPERVARFEREARVLASLNHPHIAALHGMEQFEGQHFLIMELVEGETLAERLERGPMPAEAALLIARQIAEALEAAHEKGVVHRDLKPANVKITSDDQVKVLDFGLAKAMETEPASSNVTHSPTLSLMATQAGMILGTAAYMSPEQAKGFPADQRSDVFSFGSVLYEMLTGHQPFKGDTAPDILASVLVREADLSVLPPNLNPRLHELLRRCLEKHPKKRWQAVGDLRAEIETIAAAPRAVPISASTQPVALPRPLWKRAVPVMVAALLASVLTGLAAWMLRPVPSPQIVTRFAISVPDDQQLNTGGARQLIAISPDGTEMVYAANLRLYLRSSAELQARPIPGTDMPGGISTFPVFSPDSRSVAFYSSGDRTLKRIAVSGGAAVTICPADPPYGIGWGEDGIVFGQGGKGIMRVSANGGKPEVLVGTKNLELITSPQVLPGGEAVLFTLATGTGNSTVGAAWDKAHVVVQSLKSGDRRTVVDGGSAARYVSTGHIVYALGGTVFAVPFDPKRLEVLGEPVPVVEGVRREGLSGVAHFDFANTGTLVYLPGPSSTSSGQKDLALLDRMGSTERLKLPPGSYESPRISADGKWAAFDTDDGKEAIVWVYELSGGSSMRRLTFSGNNRFPIWSADGLKVAFQSDREGDLGIFWQRADGTGTAERLTKAEQGTSHVPESSSSKGERLSYSVMKGATSAALWMYSLQDKKAEPFDNVQSSNLLDSVFSPDGAWVAYTLRGTGGNVAAAVYVEPFPATRAKYQITKDGGHHPLWSPDGKQLFYFPGADRVVAVNVTTRPSFAVGNPTAVPGGFPSNTTPQAPRNHDMGPDGRFITVVDSGQTQAGSSAVQQIQVVLNWFEELKAKAPTK